jgi:hypothetical protein
LKTELTKFIGKEVSVFVRYGFKKRTEETQSYQGKLISIDDFGVLLNRKIGESNDMIVNDFFPWHNIDSIRCRNKKQLSKLML